MNYLRSFFQFSEILAKYLSKLIFKSKKVNNLVKSTLKKKTLARLSQRIFDKNKTQ